MKNFSLAKINKILSSISNAKSKIIVGDYFFKNIEIIAGAYPFGKVCIVYTKACQALAKRFVGCILAQNLKCEKIMLESKAIYSVQDGAKLCAVSDDVRAYVTFEKELMGIVKYSACANGKPIYFGCQNGVMDGVFAPNVIIESGKGAEQVAVHASITAVTNFSEQKESLSQAYITCAMHVANFIDLIFNYYASVKRFDKQTFALISNALKQIINILEEKQANRLKTLKQCLLTLEVANFYAKDELYSVSLAVSADEFYRAKYNAFMTTAQKAYMLKVIMKSYGLIIDNFSLFTAINYTKAVAEVTSVFNLPLAFLHNRIKEQHALYLEYKNKKRKDKKLVGLINGLIQSYGKINSTYLTFGGTKASISKQVLCAIKSATLLSEFNGGTILREDGILSEFNIK